MRREWATTIGGLSLDQIESVFDRLKTKLVISDQDYHWPDIARMLALLNEGKRKSSSRVFPPSLPEPAWRQEQRRVIGKIASKTAIAVLAGRACFIEEKPE